MAVFFRHTKIGRRRRSRVISRRAPLQFLASASVPEQTFCASFDYLVGADKKDVRHGQTERHCGFEG